jgi:3-hydroxybutyryl-CoA dehydrogenase
MRRLAVVGAGTMGAGIAQVAALGGLVTRITDAQPSAVAAALARIRANLDGAVARGKISVEAAQAALDRIAGAPTVEEAARDADVAIEAVVEDLSVKQQLFTALGRVMAPGALLATNTSSLSVAAIANGTIGPERVIGMHFFIPSTS